MNIAGVYPQITGRHMGEEICGEPVGLEYLLACAEADGYNSHLFTLFDQDVEQLVAGVLEYAPDIVAVSAMTCQYPTGLRIAEELKSNLRRDIITIFGGYHPSACPSVVKEYSIDFVIRGEGEEPFRELIDALRGGTDYKNISNLAYYDGSLHMNENRRSMQSYELDELPFPKRNREMLAQKEYGLVYPSPDEQTGLAYVVGSRGCVNACDFCASRIKGREVNRRSPENIVDEIEFLVQRYGISNVFFTDLNFTQYRDACYGLCEEIIKREVPIHWECMSNINTAFKGRDKLFSKMKEAGCVKVDFGIESLNPEALRIAHKPMKYDVVEKVLRASEKAGILNTGFFMVGLPGDTKESVRMTICAVPDLPIHRLRASVATPVPGSEWYDRVPSSRKWGEYDT